MAEISILITMLKSPNAIRRYDACEEFRVMSELPDEAKATLQALLIDPDPLVVDAASRALEAHAVPTSPTRITTGAPEVAPSQVGQSPARPPRPIDCITVALVILAIPHCLMTAVSALFYNDLWGWFRFYLALFWPQHFHDVLPATALWAVQLVPALVGLFLCRRGHSAALACGMLLALAQSCLYLYVVLQT